MKKSDLLELLNNLECEDITLSQLKTLYITNNKNYTNFYVYVFYKNLEVMYVGQTTNLRKRFINHFIDKLYEDDYLTLNKNKSIEFKLNDIVLTFKSITSLKLNIDTFNKLIDKYKLP